MSLPSLQDQFAARSHARAWAATQSGAFKAEIITTGGHDADGVLKSFNYDEVIRPETIEISSASDWY